MKKGEKMRGWRDLSKIRKVLPTTRNMVGIKSMKRMRISTSGTRRRKENLKEWIQFQEVGNQTREVELLFTQLYQLRKPTWTTGWNGGFGQQYPARRLEDWQNYEAKSDAIEKEKAKNRKTAEKKKSDFVKSFLREAQRWKKLPNSRT